MSYLKVIRVLLHLVTRFSVLLPWHILAAHVNGRNMAKRLQTRCVLMKISVGDS